MALEKFGKVNFAEKSDKDSTTGISTKCLAIKAISPLPYPTLIKTPAITANKGPELMTILCFL